MNWVGGGVNSNNIWICQAKMLNKHLHNYTVHNNFQNFHAKHCMFTASAREAHSAYYAETTKKKPTLAQKTHILYKLPNTHKPTENTSGLVCDPFSQKGT